MNSIELKPELNEIRQLMKFIGDVLQKKDLQVEFILEELFVNIVNYSDASYIKINVTFEDSILTADIVDNGFEFDPTSYNDHEVPDNIDDAKIGGLGIFSTKRIADKLEYRRINGENHLTVIKKLE